MEIAPIDKIYLNDPSGNNDVAPSSIVLDVYRGDSGDRGTYVIPGLGHPTEYDFSQSYTLENGVTQVITPQAFDWYVNLKATDSTYLTIFYLDKTGQTWDTLFKIVPNTYNTNFVGLFVAGALTKNITVPAESMPIQQIFGGTQPISENNRIDFKIFRVPDEEDSVETVASELAMLALSGLTVGTYAYRTDKSQFFRLVSADESLIESWQPELSFNIDVDVEIPIPGTQYAISNGFVLGTPGIIDKEYVFPITVTAVAWTGSAFVPASGSAVIHASINVI